MVQGLTKRKAKIMVFSLDPSVSIKDRQEEEVVKFHLHVPLLSLATYGPGW